jgi:hypothetical protein
MKRFIGLISTIILVLALGISIIGCEVDETSPPPTTPPAPTQPGQP